MKKIALLSCDSLEGFVCYDELLIAPFAAAGYKAEMVSWRADVDWDQYESVIVRSTWDYQDFQEDFLRVLDDIDRSKARLENSLALMKWNINKMYLKELEESGVFIIPGKFASTYEHSLADSIFSEYQCDEIIIKPCVSANSDDAFRLSRPELDRAKEKLESLFRDRDHVCQPFIPSIIEKGEYSLFYFNGVFSHGILKTPKLGDFRVQEEHGGSLQKIEPNEKMDCTARQVLAAINSIPLYARVDLVEYKSEYALMEIELIEPSLYFNLDKESAGRFVSAYLDSLKR